MQRTLFCYARPYAGGWEATCIDLDIAVQGGTFEEVRQALNENVVSYVEDALHESEPNRSRLLSRRAPFRQRLAWVVPFITGSLFARNHDGDDHSIGFQLPCRA